jgi:DNA-binding CsgD family transcriptional regulator
METDPTLKALDRLRRRREAGEAATKATPDAIVAALEAGNTAAEIARRLGISEGYVRGIRREKKLQDPRYAHLKPPPREESAPPIKAPPARGPEPQAEASPSAPTWEELPDRFRKLPSLLAADTVARICGEHPTWHEETRALIADFFPPSFHDALEIKRASDAGILDDMDIRLP